MKKLVYLMVMAMAALSLTACGSAAQSNENNNIEDSSSTTETLYMGDAGWSVVYDEQFFNLNEIAKGQDIELDYTDECIGSSYVELMEVKGKTADEYIKEKQAEYSQTSDLYEVNSENKVGYVFYVPDITPEVTEGDNRFTSVEVLSLKDGVLVITASQILDDEMAVSDRIADIINSIELYF